MPTAVQVSGLRKTYGELAAVDGIDFTVPEGQVFAFLGPNGAGKTTTVEILEGLRKRTEGEVRVLGLDPWTQGSELHGRIGVIPQDFRFFDKIYPREAIEYYATLFGTSPDPKVLLQRVGLLDKSEARFENLSGGQKQKLGLALALVNDPRVCFLDEPTTGLDPQARRSIWEVIRTLRADGRTVFLTTHYLEEAELLADQVAIIHHGKIIAAGAPSAIIAKYGRPPRLTVEGPPSLAPYLQQKMGVPVTTEGGRIVVPMHDRADTMRMLTALEASSIPWQKFTTESDTLEDVFVALVGRMDDGEVTA
jgi:ABC-2 type transport system ATP-binding protein